MQALNIVAAEAHHAFGIDAGGDHGDAYAPLHPFEQRAAEQDVGVGIDLGADAVNRFVDLEQHQIGAAGDVDEHGAGALHRHLVEQRIGDRGFGGAQGPALAFHLAGAHHRLAHLGDHRLDVGKSRLMRPGITMRSVTPRTPACSTSSAIAKA